MYGLFKATKPVINAVRIAAALRAVTVLTTGAKTESEPKIALSEDHPDYDKQFMFKEVPRVDIQMIVTIPSFLEQFYFDVRLIESVWNNKLDSKCIFFFRKSADRAKVEALSAQLTERGIKNKFEERSHGDGFLIRLDVGIGELDSYRAMVEDGSASKLFIG